MKKNRETVTLKVNAVLEANLDKTQVASALYQVINDMVRVDDDAGCDWMTDENGLTFIANQDWLVSTNPKVAVLVDAMNIIAHGSAFKIKADYPK